MWKVSQDRHREGHVEHAIGYPVDSWTYGGGFLYHMSDQRVAVGYVVGLDYWNTYMSPFHEFQRFKAHPYVRRILEGGTCLEYGARSLNEGLTRHAMQLKACTLIMHVDITTSPSVAVVCFDGTMSPSHLVGIVLAANSCWNMVGCRIHAETFTFAMCEK